MIHMIQMDVRSYSDPAGRHELVFLRTFSVKPVNSFDPLKEKELLHLVKNKLISKGYRYNAKHPDFIVSIDFSIDPMVVQGTRYMPVPSGYVPIPYPETLHHRAVTVYITSPEGVDLWRGEVESTGSTSDIVVVAPYLLDELLSEFPYKSGKGTYRQVEFFGEQ